MNDKKLQYYSRRYLLEYSDTTSLRKLNEVISSSKKGSRIQYVLGGYLFYNKNENDLKRYPLLKTIYIDFVNAIEGNEKINSYYKVNHSIKSLANKKKQVIDFKKDVIDKIENYMQKNNLSINFLAREVSINHSTLQRFIIGKKYTEISQDKAYLILKHLRSKYE